MKPLIRVLPASSPSYTAFLCSTVRSGSTWVSEVLNAITKCRVIFEPLASHKISSWEYEERPCVPRDRDEPRLKGYFASLLSGAIYQSWIDHIGFRPWSNAMIVKLVRAAFIIGWLRENFPTVPIALLLRHPIPTAFSAMKLGWECPLETITSFRCISSEVIGHIQQSLGYSDSIFARWLTFWAVENSIALTEARRIGASVFFYESICDSPQNEFTRLASECGLPVQGFSYNRIRRPSATSRVSHEMSLEDRIESWIGECSSEQYRIAERVIGTFGLEDIYRARSPWPCT